MQRIFSGLLKVFFLCLLLAAGQSAFSQKRKKQKPAPPVAAKDSGRVAADSTKKFLVMGKYFGSSVQLRWAPKTPAAWEKANASGYQLYRFDVEPKSKNPLSGFLRLTADSLKPLSLAGMKQKFKPEDTAAAITAELLYGKKFETTGKTNGSLNWGELYTRMADEQNRLGMALLEADLHPDIADALAWRWEDRTAERGKLYYYVLVSPAVQDQPADTATVLVSTQQPYKNPEMLQVLAMPWDKTIILYWNRPVAIHFFSAYYVERSGDNGRSFQPLNRIPFVAGSNGMEKNDWIRYSDSIPQNYKKYIYRVTGVTAFGEYSRPSPPVAAAGLDKTGPHAPRQVKAENIKGSEVKISWEKAMAEKDFAGFLVGRGASANGPFFPLDTVLLPPTAQNYTDRFAVPWDKNFYIVASVDTSGNVSRSMPAYAMMEDSVAPAAPVGLIGSIDSAGRVKLHWRWNREMDLKGYNVYCSNNPDGGFYILNKDFVADSSYSDSISIKTLTRRIYYRVCAFDKTGNPSAYSSVLVLLKPDIIPPVPPVISHFRVTDSSVFIQWGPSYSGDVARQLIWRKEKKQSAWSRLDSLGPEAAQYTDTAVKPLTEYAYSLTAVDSSGLSSVNSFPVSVRVYDSGKRPGISALNLGVTEQRRIRVSWEYGGARSDLHFLLYRSYNNNGLEMYKNIPGDQRAFTDLLLPGDGDYQYAVKVVTGDGGASAPVVSKVLHYAKTNPVSKTAL